MTVAPTQIPQNPVHRWWPIVTVVAVVAVVAGTLGYALRGSGSSTSNGSVGSGTAATDARVLPPFAGVELAGSNIVTITVGKPQSVVVTADDNLLGHVTTTVESGRLVVGNTPGSITTKSPMHVEVSVPTLHAVALTGSGIVTVAGLRAEPFRVTLTGSGIVRAAGTATALDVALGGSGDAQLEHLAAQDVKATVGGSGRILVTASHRLVAAIPGNGSIVFYGNPEHVSTSVTGSGVISRG